MSKDQDIKTKQIPATNEEQKIESTELTDKDLEKVSGGALTFGREKLKDDSKTTGDFNLDNRYSVETNILNMGPGGALPSNVKPLP
jgi:bacteriocin-like protein